MNPQRHEYTVGDIVNVEGVLMGVNEGEPYARLSVAFPFATDETGLLDGVTVVVPQICVEPCYTYYYKPTASDLGDYCACEGVYEDADSDGEEIHHLSDLASEDDKEFLS